MNENKQFRSAFLALIGRPNSGKSTLMNTVLGEQLSVVTPLPQTTRQNLKGIYSTDSMQLIFVDTPGIHKGKHIFNNSMISEARTVLSEQGIDLICYLIDTSRPFGEEEQTVADIVAKSGIQTLLVFNKIDTGSTPQKVIDHYFEQFPSFLSNPYIKISAIEPSAKDTFLEAVIPFIPEGPRYFDPEDLTDANMRFFASEFIRKQIILHTQDEVPHAVFVEIESYNEEADRHDINATIHVETTGQRGIIVGKGGMVITKIRKAAERDLEKLVNTKVKIACHIKVSPKWRDNSNFLRMMGLPIR